MNICCRCLSSACVLILKVTIISSNIYIFEFGGVTEASRQGHRDAQTFQFHTWPVVKYPHTDTQTQGYKSGKCCQSLTAALLFPITGSAIRGLDSTPEPKKLCLRTGFRNKVKQLLKK